jgi:hypothetical protein
MSKTRAPPPFDPLAMQRLVDRAIREGRFSETAKRLCTGCRQWVDVIWWIDGRKELCRACAPPDRK